MTSHCRSALTKTLVILAWVSLIPSAVQAQGRGHGRHAPERSAVTTTVDVGLSIELKTQIRDFYASRPVSNVEALPPGIRRNLARGKRLPPGIAKKSAPAELVSRLPLREGYELVEVGLDVFLVEVATNVVHDVLMDVIR